MKVADLLFLQDKLVKFPEKLDLGPYCSQAAKQQEGLSTQYQLTAVCDHVGAGATSGHYTAQCRAAMSDSWYCCNDSSISRMDHHVVSSSAYLLVYRRQDD